MTYALSSNKDSYFYASCFPVLGTWDRVRCEVTEETIVKNKALYKKTCLFRYDNELESESERKKDKRILKPIGERKVFLANLNKNTLYVHQVNMTDCKYKAFMIPNVSKIFKSTLRAIPSTKFFGQVRTVKIATS